MKPILSQIESLGGCIELVFYQLHCSGSLVPIRQPHHSLLPGARRPWKVWPVVNGSPQPVCTLYTYADPPIPNPEVELREGKRGELEPLPENPG